MPKITVYYFTGYVIRSDQVVRSKRPATLEFISTHHYDPIKETAMEVDIADLDGNGFYTPKADKS